MIIRYASKDYTIISDHVTNNNFEIGNDFKLNIKLSELALNTKLLQVLNLVSMYADSYENKLRMGNPLIARCFGYTKPSATKEEAIEFFQHYLNAFANKTPFLKKDDNLVLLITNEDIQNKIL